MQTQNQTSQATEGLPSKEAVGDAVVSEERVRVSRRALYFVGSAIAALVAVALLMAI